MITIATPRFKEMLCCKGFESSRSPKPPTNKNSDYGPLQIDWNQTADIYFFEKSDNCFPSGQLPGNLPGTFRDPRKTTAPMYASGTPSGTLPGASGTAAKQKRASQPSGQLPVSFRNLPELD